MHHGKRLVRLIERHIYDWKTVVSLTIPTTSYNSLPVGKWRRLPRALWPGHTWRAMAFEITATRFDPARSKLVSARPSTMGMRMVSK